MEETVAKKQKYSSSTSSVRPGSHPTLTGTNGKTDIRIIHIFAPEIIKTDAANFRELVQRLTGKPSPESRKKPKSTGPGGRGRIMRINPESRHQDLRRSSLAAADTEPQQLRSIKLEAAEDQEGAGGGEGLCWGPFRRPERTHSNHRSNILSSSSSGGGGGGGFLGEFVDLDHQYGGLMHGLGDEFPMLPLQNVGGNINTDGGDSDHAAGLWPA